jgi:hypothetical protein
VSATHKPFAVKNVYLVRLADSGRALEASAVRDDLTMAMRVGSMDEASLSQ